MDLTKSEAINKSVNLNLDIFKDWVGLVNNAGVSVGGNAYTQLLSEWDLMMSVNLTAPFLLSQKFILNAKNRQLTGSLVNIASMVGWVGAKKPGYAASKAGIMGLTKAFAMQVGPKIRVNAICPGAMATPMTADWNEDVRMKIIENTPIGRIAEPKEIAAVVSFLLNEQQSGYLTGSIINATGGQYLG
jgi:NAD(P)-dependent dehydrogenase (short-subunit alcohol dehydrogenase family)